MSGNSRDPEAERKEKAVIAVQRAWRTYSLQKRHLDSNTRWSDAYLTARKREVNEAADQQKNDAKSRWERGIFLAGRLRDGDALHTGQAIGVDKDQNGPPAVYTQDLAEQHWLELVDGKHRYGSNLKWYYKAWMEADTNENLFRWLDRGGGKDLSLPQCSREQLEMERIQYLSAEQRLNYLAKVDPNGRLRWARNGQLVDTTPKKWKDAGGGKGIVHADGSEPTRIDPTPKEHDINNENHIRDHREALPEPGSMLHSAEGDSSISALTHHYNTHSKNSNFFKNLKERFTTAGMTDRLLRKTVAKDTWLYIADVKYNVFVGLKVTGTFQHSSFTSGGRVASAGLIRVRNGLVTELQPLSGHYRTSIDHFKQFLEEMDRQGLDLSKVHLTKGEIMLWGLDHLAKFQQRKGKFFDNRKRQLRHVVGKKTIMEKEDDEKKREEEGKTGTVPGSDDSEEDKKSDKNKDEAPQNTKDKGKGKAKDEEKQGEIQGQDLQEPEWTSRHRKRKHEEDEMWKSTSQWRWEVLTGKMRTADKAGEEKWSPGMEGATSSGV